jgi:hypothetical protein
MTTEKKGYPEKGWGSTQRPIIVKVKSEERMEQVARICAHFNWHYLMGMELVEDLTDLKKAIQEKYAPASVYEPCLCGSGTKYKFCCGKKMKNFDLNEYLNTFDNTASS